MSDIASLIQDMMNDLRKLQQEADDQHSIKMGECAQQIDDYNARIGHATQEISEATSAIKSLRKRKRKLEKDIATSESQLEMCDTEESQARSKRAQDSTDFYARQEQTKLVMDALEVIIPKMKRIDPSTAAETFAELAKIGVSNPIAALVQVASSLDADALARAILLLEELLEDFGIFLETDLEAEIQSQVNFDNLMIEIAELRK